MSQNRYYSSVAGPTSLSSSVGSSGNPVVTSITGLPPSYPFTVLIDWGLSTQEAISVTSAPTGAGPYTLPCTRGIDGTVAQSHTQGATAVHGVTAEDYNEPQVHMATSATGGGTVIHGLASGSSVVGTTDTQTLTNKTYTNPVFSGTVTVPAPVNPTDASTKNYVDTGLQAASMKTSVVVATTGALAANTYSNGTSGAGATLTASSTGTLIIDGYTVALNDRVLVKNESTAYHNGIYYCSTAGAIGVAYVLTRSLDMNGSSEIVGASVMVEAGTVNEGAGFMVMGNGPFTIGTTAINWSEFTGTGMLTAGGGISISGNTISLIDVVPSGLQTQPSGALAATFGRNQATASSTALVSGTVYMALLFITQGVTVTNINMFAGSIAKTGTSTHGWYALCDSTRHVLAVGLDQTDTATTWGTINTLESLPVFAAGSTQYVTPSSGLYYLAVMVAEASGTMPNLLSATSIPTNLNGTAPIMTGTSSTGQTTPPALGTQLTAITAAFGFNLYGYIS